MKSIDLTSLRNVYSTASLQALQNTGDMITQQISRLPEKLQQHFRGITQAHQTIGYRYRAPTIATPIILMRTTAHSDEIFEDWKNLSSHSYLERVVPGGTYSMLNPPHVRALGLAIEETLRKFGG